MAKQNTGAIWKADEKPSGRHPDYTGRLDVDGAEYRVAAWINNGSKGEYLSLAVTRKLAPGMDKPREQEPATETAEQAESFHPVDDNMPF